MFFGEFLWKYYVLVLNMENGAKGRLHINRPFELVFVYVSDTWILETRMDPRFGHVETGKVTLIYTVVCQKGNGATYTIC